MTSKRFICVFVIGFIVSAAIDAIGAAGIFHNRIVGKLFAYLTVGAAAVVADRLMSLYRARFSYDEGEVSDEARLLRGIKDADKEYVEQIRKNKDPR